MYKAILVGCGAMSEGWLKAIKSNAVLSDRVDIVGFVDLDVSRANALADRFYPHALRSTDLAEALTKAGPDIVFDTVVPAARQSVVETAFAAGCDVLSEKPMGNTLDEARALLEAGKKAGRLHAVVQNRRYLTGARRAKAFLDSGAIGAVAEVHCDFFMAPHFGGFREEMQHVLLHDMAIHTFDAARFVTGFEPQSVYCLESNPNGSWYAHGASAAAIFKGADNVVMTYRGSWCSEGAPTSWEAQWRIIGTKGTLIWDGNTGFNAEVVASDTGFLRAHDPVVVPDFDETGLLSGHAGVLQDFLEACATRLPPLTAATDNFRSLAMTFAAIESAEKQHIITLQS